MEQSTGNWRGDLRRMEGVHLEIQPQPDDTTCGPTCLQAVYQYYGDEITLSQVISEAESLDEGGTLAPLLGRHALERGYDVTIYTFNLRLFDPTWFGDLKTSLVSKLTSLLAEKSDVRLRRAGQAYLRFLQAGGRLLMEDLTRRLIREYLKHGTPILTGLSSTYLYQSPRELSPEGTPDDIRGVPTGHFVVLCGYDRQQKLVRVADPYLPNPIAPKDHYYQVNVDRVVCAILLGILTYDANLLVIRPRRGRHLPSPPAISP